MIDPVCGMKVAADSPHQASHARHNYRFCSAGCRAKFVADPVRYLKPESITVETGPAGTQYTCPMHPEILRDVPGDCPICGMALEPVLPAAEDEESPELADFRRRFWWTLPLSFAVLALAMAGRRLELAPGLRGWFELLLSAPVVLWAGWPFFQRWVRSIATRHPNMWTLIGTGVGAAFLYSLVATLAPDWFPDSFREHGRAGVYFEAAAVIVSLTLLGQVLELRARSSTSAAIRALLRLAPPTARRIRENGAEEDVALAAVQVGDRLRVRPGLVDPGEQPAQESEARRCVAAGSAGWGPGAVAGATAATGCPAQAATRARKLACGANTLGIATEHAVGDAAVQVGVGVECRAEALHEVDRPTARASAAVSSVKRHGSTRVSSLNRRYHAWEKRAGR